MLTCKEGTIQSERNGIYTKNSGKPGRGNVEILEGAYSVIGGKYAIRAAQNLHINDCSILLYGVVDSFSANGSVYIQEGCLINE